MCLPLWFAEACLAWSCCAPLTFCHYGRKYRGSRSCWPSGCWDVAQPWGLWTLIFHPSSFVWRTHQLCTPTRSRWGTDKKNTSQQKVVLHHLVAVFFVLLPSAGLRKMLSNLTSFFPCCHVLTFLLSFFSSFCLMSLWLSYGWPSFPAGNCLFTLTVLPNIKKKKDRRRRFPGW